MLERSFAKYARAVSDERERKSLYKLFCARIVMGVLFFCMCIAIVAVSLFSDEAEKTMSDPILITFGILLLLWLVSAVAWIVLAVKFRLRYRAILNRPPTEGEPPESVRFRSKTREANKSLFKSMVIPIILIAVGIIYFIASIVIDVIQNPDSEEFSAWGKSGIAVFAVTFVVGVFWIAILQAKKSAEGKTAQMQTSDEAKAIDEAQGRKHKYSLDEDKNAYSYRYLFPTQELYAEAEKLRKKQLKATYIAVGIALLISFVICFVFFSPYVFDWNLVGYAYPVLMTIVAIATAAATVPFALKQKKLETRQKEIFETNPSYEPNKRLFAMYEAYSRSKGLVLPILLGVSLAASYVLAIVFPHALWSLLGVVPLFVGSFLNMKFIADLRKSAQLIEAEIDNAYREAKFAVETETDEQRLEVYQGVKVCYHAEEGELVCANGGGDIEIYLGGTLLCFSMDLETKRISGFSGVISLKDQAKENIEKPDEFTVGILQLEGEADLPRGSGIRIKFGDACTYDPEKKLLRLGVFGIGRTYKILGNVYVCLTDKGELVGVMIEDL